MIYSLTGKYPIELKSNSLNGEVEWQSYVPNLDQSLKAVLENATKIDLSKRYLTADEMLQDLNMSGIHTMVITPKKKNIPASQIGMIENNDILESGRTKIPYRETPPRINHKPENVHQGANIQPPTFKQKTVQPSPVTPINQNNFDTTPSNWWSIILTAVLVSIGVSTGFLVYQYVKNTQVELADIEQQKTEIEAQLEEEQQKRLEEENRRLQAEKLRREAELERIKREQEEQKEKERLEELATEENPFTGEINPTEEVPSESENAEEVPNESENSEVTTLQPQDAIATIQTFYNLVSQKQYNQARSYFADPNLLDPNFFNQFTQVTVTELQVTGENEQSFTLVGTNTYYYPDGTTQTERRDYTLQPIDNKLKITASNFIRVIKVRS